MVQLLLPKLLFRRIRSNVDLQNLLSILIILFSIGCGPKVITAKLSNETKLRSVVILPASSNTDIAREKIDLVQDLFSRKIIAKGFQQISEQKFSDYCKNNEED